MQDKNQTIDTPPNVIDIWQAAAVLEMLVPECIKLTIQISK